MLSGPLPALLPCTVTVPRVSIESSDFLASANAEGNGLREKRLTDSRGHIEIERDMGLRFALGKIRGEGMTYIS
ncbi:hypothetical protein D3C80_1889370 [compost metagenome]